MTPNPTTPISADAPTSADPVETQYRPRAEQQAQAQAQDAVRRRENFITIYAPDGCRFKGRNGHAKMSSALVWQLDGIIGPQLAGAPPVEPTSELYVEIRSKRLSGDIAPAYIAGPPVQILTLLEGLLIAAYKVAGIDPPEPLITAEDRALLDPPSDAPDLLFQAFDAITRTAAKSGADAIDRLAHILPDLAAAVGIEITTCKYCGRPINEDTTGAWIDATDGDGCPEHEIDGMTAGHEPEKPRR